MTTTESKTRLREVARADEDDAVATHEAIHFDRVLGIIKKFKDPDWAPDNEGKQNLYRNCYWTHSLDDGSGRDRYETSAACIEALERAAGVMPEFKVQRWQTYVPCHPPSWGQRSKPFIVDEVVGDKVKVWDPTGGQRMGGYRWIALRNLHETGTTARGKERQTGFALQSGPPTKGQELCGSCFVWLDRDKIAVSAHGFGHSTCIPCMADIDERYGTAHDD